MLKEGTSSEDLKERNKINMKSVCILGSQRFKDEIDEYTKQLESRGITVFAPEFKDRSRAMADMPESQRLQVPEYRLRIPGLVHAHLQRIRESDVCFVYNPKGYVGVNTTIEIGFAHGLNKILYTLEEETDYNSGGELCRQVLFNKSVSFDELCEKLK